MKCTAGFCITLVEHSSWYREFINYVSSNFTLLPSSLITHGCNTQAGACPGKLGAFVDWAVKPIGNSVSIKMTLIF